MSTPQVINGISRVEPLKGRNTQNIQSILGIPDSQDNQSNLKIQGKVRNRSQLAFKVNLQIGSLKEPYYKILI